MHLASERLRTLEMSGSDSLARIMATTSSFDCACVEDLWTLLSGALGQTEFLSVYNIANGVGPIPDADCAQPKPDEDDRDNDHDCYFFNLLEANPRLQKIDIKLKVCNSGNPTRQGERASAASARLAVFPSNFTGCPCMSVSRHFVF